MKTAVAVFALIFQIIIFSGCDDSGSAINPLAAKAEIQSTLPSDGVPDMNSVTDLYKRVVETIGNNGKSAQFEFTPEEVQEIANMGAGLPLGERWEMMRLELARRHPGKIADTLKWTFNAAGN